MSYTKKYKSMSNYPGHEPKETIKEILELPIMAWPERNLRKETCERFGVRFALSQKNGKDLIAVFFPYYDQRGKLSGFKKKDLTIDKSERGHYTAIGKVGVECKMFGQDVAESVQRNHNAVLIAEGETDCMSIYQAMVDSVKGTKYEGMEPFVTSISCGTVNAVESCLHNKEFLSSFAALTLTFDNDSCTEHEKKTGKVRGAEATENVAAAFMGDGKPIFKVEYPAEYKDASDLLQAGEDQQLAKLMQFGKKPYSAEKILTADSFSVEDLIADRPEGIYTKVFPKLDNKLHGFRPYELCILTSPSNVGKSLVTNEIMYKFLEEGQPCGFICLEERVEETIQRILAKRCGVNYNKFKESPTTVTTKEKIEEAYRWLTQDRKAYFLDHFGSLKTDDFMNKVKSFVFVNGVKYLLIDHCSMIFSGTATDNERKEVDILMTQLAAFCAANEVCIIAVSHLNRSIATDFKPPKTKDGKEPDSWWVPVTKEAMRSSASLEQLSWTVLGLEPQILASKERGHVRLTVLKNRTHGYLGICDEFIIDDNTGEVILFDNNFGGF